MEYHGNRSGNGVGFLTGAFLLLGIAATAGAVSTETQTPATAAVVTNITGTITDSTTGAPIADVEVSVVGTKIRGKTDSTGAYRLRGVSEGDQVLRIRHVTYLPKITEVAVPASGTITVDIVLMPRAKNLIPPSVTIVTDEDIAERNYASFYDMFKGDVPGVFAQTNDYGNYLSLSVRGAQGSGNAIIILDGKLLDDLTSLNYLDPRTIERVEVLKGQQAAEMYGGDSSTGGVIAIITKKGSAGGHADDLVKRIMAVRRQLMEAQREIDQLLEEALRMRDEKPGHRPLEESLDVPTLNEVLVSGGEGVGGLMLDFVADSGSSYTVGEDGTLELQWTASLARLPEEYGHGFRAHCGPGEATGPIWGTGVYTDDSSICTAAVHAGIISSEEGGMVQVEVLPGRQHYLGTKRNGVQSQSYSKWPRSFRVTEPEQ